MTAFFKQTGTIKSTNHEGKMGWEIKWFPRPLVHQQHIQGFVHARAHIVCTHAYNEMKPKDLFTCISHDGYDSLVGVCGQV